MTVRSSRLITATKPKPTEYAVRLRRPHARQEAFIYSPARRKIIRAGRRSGKTTGVAQLAVLAFVAGRRVLYAAPTQEQIARFWTEVKRALVEPLSSGALYKNETEHIIEVLNTEQRIRAKTAWDADSLRGDYADLLILDEYQLMSEDAWGRVGAPMLADNNGDAVFIYTPPSLHSRSRTKARDPRHAAKLFKKAQADESGRWQAFHFTSFDNPHVSRTALNELAEDMTALAYEQEIMAEDKDEAPGALWTSALLDAGRISLAQLPDLRRVVVGVDPPGGAVECGIVVAGQGLDGHFYVLADNSLLGSPGVWGAAVVRAYEDHRADRVVAEKNYGGDMVQSIIRAADGGALVSYQDVVATRGKAIRAEPIAALYERGFVHHVGAFYHLEDEMKTWQPGITVRSPNRLDALVWALTALKGGGALIA